VAAIASCPDLFEPCPIWQWDGAAVLLVLKLAEDPGARPEIFRIEGFLMLRNLDRSPRDDEPIALKAHMHVVLFYAWQVKDGRYRKSVGGLSVLYV
jgi:hypothetical protein